MKNLIFFVLILICSQYIQGQSSLDFIQEQRPLTNDHVIIYLDTTHMIDVKVKYVSDDIMRIQTSVESAHAKKAVLEYLKRDGRYNLDIYEHSRFYATVLSMKNEIKYIFINNAEFIEKITYTLHLPKETKYEIRVPKNAHPKQMPIAVR